MPCRRHGTTPGLGQSQGRVLLAQNAAHGCWCDGQRLQCCDDPRTCCGHKLFGMGTHMLRLVLHVPILLRQEGLVTVAACKPDASELCFAAEYKDIVLANFEGTKKQRLNLSNRLDGLFSRWTGGYFERGRIMSTYDPPNMDNFLKELECCYIDVVLPCNPARPSMGKWTPLFLCVWWFVKSLIGGLVSMLLESALGALKGSDATILEQMKEATEGSQLDIAWSHVATSKRRVTEGRYRDQTWCVRISIMWVLYEGLWILARYYMGCSLANPYRANDDWPELMNLLNGNYSILDFVLQWLSTLLAEPSSCKRLILVMANRGCTSYREWAARFPDDIALFERGTLTIIASIERRQRMYAHKHFGVLSAGDWRLSELERTSCLRTYIRPRSCCTQYGVSRGLRLYGMKLVAISKGITVDEVTTEDAIAALHRVSRIFLLIAAYVSFSIAFLENVNKYHREISVAGKSSLDMLTAMSLCGHARKRFEQWSEALTSLSRVQPQQQHALCDVHQQEQHARGDAVNFQLALFRDVRRRLTPLEVCRKRTMATERSEGIRRRWVSFATHKYYRERWAAASEEDKKVAGILLIVRRQWPLGIVHETILSRGSRRR